MLSAEAPTQPQRSQSGLARRSDSGLPTLGGVKTPRPSTPGAGKNRGQLPPVETPVVEWNRAFWQLSLSKLSASQAPLHHGQPAPISLPQGGINAFSSDANLGSPMPPRSAMGSTAFNTAAANTIAAGVNVALPDAATTAQHALSALVAATPEALVMDDVQRRAAATALFMLLHAPSGTVAASGGPLAAPVAGGGFCDPAVLASCAECGIDRAVANARARLRLQRASGVQLRRDTAERISRFRPATPHNPAPYPGTPGSLPPTPHNNAAPGGAPPVILSPAQVVTDATFDDETMTAVAAVSEASLAQQQAGSQRNSEVPLSPRSTAALTSASAAAWTAIGSNLTHPRTLTAIQLSSLALLRRVFTYKCALVAAFYNRGASAVRGVALGETWSAGLDRTGQVHLWGSGAFGPTVEEAPLPPQVALAADLEAGPPPELQSPRGAAGGMSGKYGPSGKTNASSDCATGADCSTSGFQRSRSTVNTTGTGGYGSTTLRTGIASPQAQLARGFIAMAWVGDVLALVTRGGDLMIAQVAPSAHKYTAQQQHQLVQSAGVPASVPLNATTAATAGTSRYQNSNIFNSKQLGQILSAAPEGLPVRILSGITGVSGVAGGLTAMGPNGQVYYVSFARPRSQMDGGLIPFRACEMAYLTPQQDMLLVLKGHRKPLFKCGWTATSGNVNTPRRVATLPDISVAAVAGGHRFAVVIDTNGGMWVQGYNEFGQLGLPAPQHIRTFTPHKEMTARAFLTDVACGKRHTVVLSVDGVAYAAGSNKHGQVALDARQSAYGSTAGGLVKPGENPATDVPCSRLFQRVRLPARCVAVAAGPNASLFVLSDQRVMLCGNNEFGQLGFQACVSVNPPLPLPRTLVLPPQVTTTPHLTANMASAFPGLMHASRVAFVAGKVAAAAASMAASQAAWVWEQETRTQQRKAGGNVSVAHHPEVEVALTTSRATRAVAGRVAAFAVDARQDSTTEATQFGDGVAPRDHAASLLPLVTPSPAPPAGIPMSPSRGAPGHRRMTSLTSQSSTGTAAPGGVSPILAVGPTFLYPGLQLGGVAAGANVKEATVVGGVVTGTSATGGGAGTALEIYGAVPATDAPSPDERSGSSGCCGGSNTPPRLRPANNGQVEPLDTLDDENARVRPRGACCCDAQ